MKPLTKALIARFGSLAGTLAASPAELKSVAGVGEAPALDLTLLHEITLRISRQALAKRTVITFWSQLLDYVKIAPAHEPREQFMAILLDKKNQLIADEVMNHGAVDHAPVYPREVMRRGLELSAIAVILVHNHPSGAPTPFERRHKDDPSGRRSRSLAAHLHPRPSGGRSRRRGELPGAWPVLRIPLC